MRRFVFAQAFFASITGLMTFAVIVPQAACLAQPPGAGGSPANAGAAGLSNGGNKTIRRLEIVEIEGTYQGAVNGVMKVKRDDDMEVFVQLPPDPSKLRFSAEPDPQMIQPGLVIRFQADFGPDGLPTAPISNVEIIRPMNARGMSRSVKESLTPGVYPLERRPGDPRQARFIPGPHRVVGVLRGAAQGTMMVAAGNTPVQTGIADDAEFVIRFNTLELAQPGDHVKVAGFYQLPDKTIVRADTVEVSTERVIGAEQPKPERRGRRGRGRTKNETPPAAAANADESDKAAADDPFAPR